MYFSIRAKAIAFLACLFVLSSCSTKNRIDLTTSDWGQLTAGQQVVYKDTASSKYVQFRLIDSSALKSLITRNNKSVVDIIAPWCPFCHKNGRTIHELSKQAEVPVLCLSVSYDLPGLFRMHLKGAIPQDVYLLDSTSFGATEDERILSSANMLARWGKFDLEDKINRSIPKTFLFNNSTCRFYVDGALLKSDHEPFLNAFKP